MENANNCWQRRGGLRLDYWLTSPSPIKKFNISTQEGLAYKRLSRFFPMGGWIILMGVMTEGPFWPPKSKLFLGSSWPQILLGLSLGSPQIPLTPYPPHPGLHKIIFFSNPIFFYSKCSVKVFTFLYEFTTKRAKLYDVYKIVLFLKTHFPLGKKNHYVLIN